MLINDSEKKDGFNVNLGKNIIIQKRVAKPLFCNPFMTKEI